jgi:UDPglucose 6-dehydrogenase
VRGDRGRRGRGGQRHRPDSRIGPKFLKASVGFGGSCFQKDILNLVYLCEHFGLPEVAAYWEGVVRMNDWQKHRFTSKIVKALYNSVADKKIAVLGFAFKKDTNDTRESPAIAVCRDLIAEQARVTVYDPKVPADEIRRDVLGKDSDNPSSRSPRTPTRRPRGPTPSRSRPSGTSSRSSTSRGSTSLMSKPAFIFDGRNILDLPKLREIGFRASGIGK